MFSVQTSRPAPPPPPPLPDVGLSKDSLESSPRLSMLQPRQIISMCYVDREFRKPLVVMSPKNLLRHKECKSNLSEFDDIQGHPGFDQQGTRFKRLIKDQNDHSNLEGIRRLVLCPGKVYYELDEHRKSIDGKDVAICHAGQLCSLPYDLVQRELKRYPSMFRLNACIDCVFWK